MSAAVQHPVYYAQPDDELAALFMQLEEIDQAAQSSRGKNRVDQPVDFDTVHAIFQAELEDYQNFLNDQKLAQSIGTAVNTDGTIIESLTAQDIQLHNDRHLVLQLNSDATTNAFPLDATSAALPSDTKQWMANLGHAVHAQPTSRVEEDKTEAGPSMTAAERQAKTIAKFSTEVECMSCTDKLPRGNLISTKCGHKFCAVCVRKYFVQSTKDASSFPPQCCQVPIALQLVAKHMNADELSAYHLAAAEFETTDRVYCSAPDCGMFIKPEIIHPGTQCATCPRCDTKTCAICKNDFHEGQDCPDDPSLRQTRELAQRKGWQTCGKCNRLVQLSTGCNHNFRCFCGYEFCYVCGKRWKSCHCQTADIHRIEETADDVVS